MRHGKRAGFEEEPEEEPDAEPPAAEAGPGLPVPSVGSGEGRELEFRTELLSAEQLLDGTTLAQRLNAASSDGWDLVQVIAAGDRHAVLLRRPKKVERGGRQVGFFPTRSDEVKAG